MSQSDRRSYWQGVLQEQIASGVSIRGWCAANGVNIHTFQYWRSRLSEAAPPVETNRSPVVAEPPVSNWLEVVPASVKRSKQENGHKHKKKSSVSSLVGSPGSAICLQVGRVSVDVGPGFDASLLTRVLDLLEARC